MNNEVEHFWNLLLGMTEKELRARYKYTLFGFIWLVANPILQMLIIGFVFTFFLKQQVSNYYHYLFIGLLVWNFFSLSLLKATPSIVFERTLIKKSRFPRSVIPLSIILSNFIHFIIALLIFFIPLSFIGTLSFPRVLFVFPAIIMLALFTIGAALTATALNVKYRDVNFFVQALLIVWFYATPIIYSLSQIPPSIYWVWRLNPMTAIIQLFQLALLGLPGPGIAMFISNTGVEILIVALGILLFREESKNFDDWI